VEDNGQPPDTVIVAIYKSLAARKDCLPSIELFVLIDTRLVPPSTRPAAAAHHLFGQPNCSARNER
jgi:hypothetical protein